MLHAAVLRGEEKVAAVSGSEQVIKQITGKRTYYFRFPGGSIECARQREVALVAALGEQPVDWTAAGDAYQPDPQAVVDSVMTNIRSGAIVALHMHGSDETRTRPPPMRHSRCSFPSSDLRVTSSSRSASSSAMAPAAS